MGPQGIMIPLRLPHSGTPVSVRHSVGINAPDEGRRLAPPCEPLPTSRVARRFTVVANSDDGAEMPVTAKLSRKFYETFGDELTNELVEWFNAVDATYRTDLRELNELNFARFDAKLEQRIAEVRKDMEAGFARMDGRLDRRLAAVEVKLIRWMFVFWATTGLALVALLLRS